MKTQMTRGRAALLCILVGHVIPDGESKCTRPGCKSELWNPQEKA